MRWQGWWWTHSKMKWRKKKLYPKERTISKNKRLEFEQPSQRGRGEMRFRKYEFLARRWKMAAWPHSRSTDSIQPRQNGTDITWTDESLATKCLFRMGFRGIEFGWSEQQMSSRYPCGSKKITGLKKKKTHQQPLSPLKTQSRAQRPYYSATKPNQALPMMKWVVWAFTTIIISSFPTITVIVIILST